jgi:hypothetical protein
MTDVALTENAAALLSQRLHSSPLGEGAGLRIWGLMIDDELMLTSNFTEGPTRVDEVVEESGARVFLDPDVARHFDHKTISVHDDGEHVALVVIDEWSADDDSLF